MAFPSFHPHVSYLLWLQFFFFCLETGSHSVLSGGLELAVQGVAAPPLLLTGSTHCHSWLCESDGVCFLSFVLNSFLNEAIY